MNASFNQTKICMICKYCLLYSRASEANLNRNVTERSLYMLTELLHTLQISLHFNHILNIDPLKHFAYFFFFKKVEEALGIGGGGAVHDKYKNKLPQLTKWRLPYTCEKVLFCFPLISVNLSVLS